MRQTVAVVGLITSIILSLSTATYSSAEQTPRAYLGNTSGGTDGGGEIDFVYEDSMRLASEYQHEFVRPEHMLLVLLDVQSVSELMTVAAIDTTALRRNLVAYLKAFQVSPASGNEPLMHPSLQSIVQKAQYDGGGGEAKSIDGLDILLAMLETRDSFAAEALISEGAAVELLTPEATEIADKRSERRNEDLAAFMSALDEIKSSGNEVQSCDNYHEEGSRELVFRVTAALGETAKFKAAISHDGHLELMVEQTPFEKRLRAASYALLAEFIDPDVHTVVEVFEMIDNELRQIGGVGGAGSVAIFSDDRSHRSRCSGRL